MNKIIQPICYFINRDFRYYYLWKLMKNLKLTREEILKLQNKKLKKLITHAYNTTPFYKRYFDVNKLNPEEIKTSSDLMKLPIMTKQMIKDNVDEIKSTGYKKLKRVTSGGSTGETGIVYKSPYFLQLGHAAMLRNLSIAGWLPHYKSAWIWGAPYENQQIKDSLRSKLSIFINKRLFFNAYNYSPNDFPLWAKKIELFKPIVLYGYSSIILEFSKWCINNKINFKSLKTVVSTTEKLINREMIERAFQCKVYDLYGCREVPAIAIECRDGNLHISDDTVIVEQTNENHLLITALDSFYFPIIRYKIGDTGKKLDRICSCGSNFSLIDLDIGRVTDNFIRPNGMKISGSALATYISTLNINFVKYQLIQNNINRFEVRFIADDNTYEEDKKKFIKALEKYFGNVEVDFIRVEEIPPEPSGKRLLYKCLIKDN